MHEDLKNQFILQKNYTQNMHPLPKILVLFESLNQK